MATSKPSKKFDTDATPSSKDGAPDAAKKTKLIGIAVVCILAAAGMLAWQFGLFTKPEPPGLTKIVPAEQTIPEEKKEEFRKNLKLEEEQRAKSGPPAGA